jgi:hypothetical protein
VFEKSLFALTAKAEFFATVSIDKERNASRDRLPGKSRKKRDVSSGGGILDVFYDMLEYKQIIDTYERFRRRQAYFLRTAFWSVLPDGEGTTSDEENENADEDAKITHRSNETKLLLEEDLGAMEHECSVLIRQLKTYTKMIVAELSSIDLEGDKIAESDNLKAYKLYDTILTGALRGNIESSLKSVLMCANVGISHFSYLTRGRQVRRGKNLVELPSGGLRKTEFSGHVVISVHSDKDLEESLHRILAKIRGVSGRYIEKLKRLPTAKKTAEEDVSVSNTYGMLAAHIIQDEEGRNIFIPFMASKLNARCGDRGLSSHTMNKSNILSVREKTDTAAMVRFIANYHPPVLDITLNGHGIPSNVKKNTNVGGAGNSNVVNVVSYLLN